MGLKGTTVYGFRSTFCDWAGEAANTPRELVEMSLSHKVGSDVEQADARSDLLERRRELMGKRSDYVTSASRQVSRM
ncbi:hypothetical protein JSE7799_01854 [Jannaschia seosinensis]|uniref:Integrase n=1 Tax=Jannaschia seosinensis TaxID=313367 RepID=A0A0M7BB43_9RHOB|nr:hypothetical protein [Jannaschia seosinensis]CUH39133.1 hypothetical protein JSE7799_01854 [Jannaschia seosinensis]